MRLLLDTHALIWWMMDHPSLPAAARSAIADPENAVFISAASAMEIATKHRIGKLPEAALLAREFEEQIALEGFLPLPITLAHARPAGSLLIAHKDPFDRLLIAQAQEDDMVLASNEALFDDFGVKRLW